MKLLTKISFRLKAICPKKLIYFRWLLPFSGWVWASKQEPQNHLFPECRNHTGARTHDIVLHDCRGDTRFKLYKYFTLSFPNKLNVTASWHQFSFILLKVSIHILSQFKGIWLGFWPKFFLEKNLVISSFKHFTLMMDETMRCKVILPKTKMRGEITEYYFYRLCPDINSKFSLSSI